jgi:hypothetical protein
MTFSRKIRLGFLASAVALAFAAPSAFAQAGKTAGGFHTDPGGTPDAPAAMHSEQVMKKTNTCCGVALDSGKIVAGLHTDAGGTPDAPAAVHTEQVMKKKSGRIDTVVPLSKPAY